MLEQAKNAKERMLRAGFQYPKDFTVRTERMRKPLMGFIGYGRAIITINPTADTKAVERIEAMRQQGLSITHYRGSRRQWVRAEDDQQGRYVVVDFSQGTTTGIIHNHDARLISLPEGVQIMRDNNIRYHWYNQITDTSRRRLWRLMDQCLQLVSNPNIHIWHSQRRAERQVR